MSVYFCAGCGQSVGAGNALHTAGCPSQEPCKPSVEARVAAIEERLRELAGAVAALSDRVEALAGARERRYGPGRKKA